MYKVSICLSCLKCKPTPTEIVEQCREYEKKKKKPSNKTKNHS
jgi:hypothetical protein